MCAQANKSTREQERNEQSKMDEDKNHSSALNATQVDAKEEQAIRPEMVNYFKAPNLVWFLVIPGSLGLAFVVYYNVQWIPTNHLSFIGDFLYTLGTKYNWLMRIICIGALIAHIGEGIWALYICDSLGFSHACALKWFIQTFILGYPSLRLLRAYRKKKTIGKQKK